MSVKKIKCIRYNFIVYIIALLTISSPQAFANQRHVRTAGNFLAQCQNIKTPEGKGFCLGVINGLANSFNQQQVNGIMDLMSYNPNNFSSNKEYVLCQKAVQNSLDSTINKIPNDKLVMYLIRYIESNNDEEKNSVSSAFDNLMVKSFNGKLSLFPEQCTPNMTFKQRGVQEKLITSLRKKSDKIIP